MPVVMILPGWMMGPGDASPTADGQLILDLLHGDLPRILDGGSSTVDARDVAQGKINAVDLGESGERYIVAGRYHSLAELAQTVEKVSGVEVPKRVIPYPLAWCVAWMSETIARLGGRETVMTVSGVRTLRKGIEHNSGKAMRDLGVSFRPFEQTIADEIRWYHDNGYINDSVKIDGDIRRTAAVANA